MWKYPISHEMVIFKANDIFPEKKIMNNFVGDVLLLVQILLVLAFISIHYFLYL